MRLCAALAGRLPVESRLGTLHGVVGRMTNHNRRARKRKPGKIREHNAEYGQPAPPPITFRFVDLFCGIGGFRIAFERAGCEYVFSCDWDKHSQVTYEANFGEKPHGDIHSIAIADIPKHNILCAEQVITSP